MKNKPSGTGHTPSRRQFLQAGAIGAGMALEGLAFPKRAYAQTPKTDKHPNFLVIVCDQFGLDAISAHGCPDVHTPNIDRLISRGVTFLESHSTNPVCSPARSSLVTGRMPVETGVIVNDCAVNRSVPDMGQWFRQHGYDTVYCGKWHLPLTYPISLDGFEVLPVGQGQGDLVDNVVSRSSEAWLTNRTSDRPFLLVTSLMQPHDICYWAIRNKLLVPELLPFPELDGQLPALPPNHRAAPPEPKELANKRFTQFDDDQWRYYIYTYYRQVEMADADIGRVLDALEDAGRLEDTVVVFTADHGEGRGRHMHVQKWYPYEESVKVPFVISCPGRIGEGLRDATHLVSGADLMPTFCDYAGIDMPSQSVGMSLRPLLEGRQTEWREYVVAETFRIGRMVRTEQFKYVYYQDDPVEMLFDMKADPWETENLYQQSKYADVMKDHRRLLKEHQARLTPVEPSPRVI